MRYAPGPETDNLIKHYEKAVDEETGEERIIPVRYMNAAEIKEREDMYIANTASALRRKVLDHLAGTNGSNGGNGTITT
jgi:hypothetical protein